MEPEHNYVLSFAKKVWHSYLVDRDYAFLLPQFDEKLSWIGTGKDEFYPFSKEALSAVRREFSKDSGSLEILRERYHPISLGNGVWLVIGFILACAPGGREDLAFLPIRFTAVIRRNPETDFKIIHFHTSVSSDSQENGAFLPACISRRSYETLARQMSKKTREMQALANGISGGVARILLDKDRFVLLYANDGFFLLGGRECAQFGDTPIKCNPEQLIHPADCKELLAALHKTAGTSETLSREIRIYKQDGALAWIYLRITFLEMQGGRPVFQGVFVDLTEQKKTQQNLERTNRELRQLTDSIPGGVAAVLLDEELTLLYANDRFFNLIGCSDNDSGNNCQLGISVHPDDLCGLQKLLRERIIRNEMAHTECRIRLADGKYIWLALNASKIDEQNGFPLMLCVFMDITNLKSAQQALEIEKERYRIVASFSKDRLFEFDLASDSLYYFNSGSRTSQSEYYFPSFRETMVGRNAVYPEDLPVFHQLCDHMENGISEFTFELRCSLLTDQYCWMRVQGKTICNELGVPVKVIGSLSNIDAQKREIEGLIEKAQFDTLTGLYNRGTAETLLGQIIAQEPNHQHAFIIADLDRFKDINDTLGHMTGDSVLTEVSGQLRKIMRDTDIVGRLGGDEFLIFLKSIGTVGAIRRKAQEICDIFRGTKIGNNSRPISGSVGIALYPHDGSNFDELFAKADAALYGAKRRGKDCYMFYSSEIEQPGGTSPDEPDSQEEGALYTPGFQQTLRELLDCAADSQVTTQQLLAGTGRLLNLSRVVLLESAEGSEGRLRISNEWCDKGAPSMRGTQQKISVPEWRSGFLPHFRDGILVCSDTRMLRLPESIRVIYVRFSTRAQVQYLIGTPKMPLGAVCFDICDRVHEWSCEEINALSALAKVIAARLLDSRAKEQFSGCNLLLEAAEHNPNLYSYAVRPNTYKLVFLDPGMQQLYPDANPGDLCYQAFHFGGSPCMDCPMKPENGGISEYFNSQLGWWVNATSSRISMEGNEDSIVLCFSNITSFRRRIMTTDSLTGLSNMTEFETDALSLLKRRGRSKYALVYMDFNKFKYINEACGYHTGDQVLIAFSRALLSSLHPGELACRYTSDLFLTLLRYDDRGELETRLQNLQAKMAESVRDITQGLAISISGGICYVEPDGTGDFITIMDRANIARKSIKGAQANSFAVYDRALHLKTTREKEIELLMAGALKNNEFVVFFQPKIDLKTGKIVGAEALVRWHRDFGQMVMPSEFIPLFEKNNFIKQLDLYIHDQVFQLLRKCLDEGKPLVPISVNISRIDILDDRFIPFFETSLKKYRLPPELIELELTESIFLDTTDTLIESINRLRAMGMLFSIDDFGSGYSSLNLLRRLPIDVLKLDREFLSSGHSTQKEQAVISSVIHMAKSLDIVVLSEGVETAEQAEFLKSAGCDLAQGFLYSKPLPVDAFLNKLAEES